MLVKDERTAPLIFPFYHSREGCKAGNLPPMATQHSVHDPLCHGPQSIYRSPWILWVSRGTGQPLGMRQSGRAACSTPTAGAVALPSVVGCRETHNKSFHLSLWLNASALACWKCHLSGCYRLTEVHARQYKLGDNSFAHLLAKAFSQDWLCLQLEIVWVWRMGNLN